MPEHGAFAGGLIDKDDGELVVGLPDDDVERSTLRSGEVLAHAAAVRVVADWAEKAGGRPSAPHVASIVATWPPQETKCALMRSLVSAAAPPGAQGRRLT